MKTTLKIVLIAVLLLALCCVAVYVVGIFVNFERIISGFFTTNTTEPQTEKYKNYVCVDANLTFAKEDVIDLEEKYRSTADKVDFYYYQIKGFDTKEIVAAEAFSGFAVGWGYDSQLILTDPENEFEPFKDWTIKEIWVGDKQLTSSDYQELIDDFIYQVEYAKTVAENQCLEDASNEHDKAPQNESLDDEWYGFIDSKDCAIKVVFNETADVYWEIRVNIKRWQYGGNKIIFCIGVFDPYPQKHTKYVIVPQDALFCKEVVKLLFE